MIFNATSQRPPLQPFFLKTDDRQEGSPRLDAQENVLPSGDGGGIKIICVSCGNEVTTVAAKTSVQDAHRHVFCNPHGFVYEIGCYSRAPGCVAVGLPSYEFSWFPGYAWQIGACSECGTHLGWRFSAGTHTFFALILDSIQEEHDCPA